MPVVAGEVLSEGAGGEGQPAGVGAALTVLLQSVLLDPLSPPGRPRHVQLEAEQVDTAGLEESPDSVLLLQPVPLVALEVVADLLVLVLDQVVVPVRSTTPRPCRQCSPLSLVEEGRGLALIGRELQSVATPALLCHKGLKCPPCWGHFACLELVLYCIRIGGFHGRKGKDQSDSVPTKIQ